MPPYWVLSMGRFFYSENFEVKLLRPSSTATDDECLHEITFANDFQKNHYICLYFEL
jgi:hypothetical protein